MVVVLYLVLSLHGAVVDSGGRRLGRHGPVGDGPSATAASPSRSHHPVAVVVPDADAAVHGSDGGAGRGSGGA